VQGEECEKLMRPFQKKRRIGKGTSVYTPWANPEEFEKYMVAVFGKVDRIMRKTDGQGKRTSPTLDLRETKFRRGSESSGTRSALEKSRKQGDQGRESFRKNDRSATHDLDEHGIQLSITFDEWPQPGGDRKKIAEQQKRRLISST